MKTYTVTFSGAFIVNAETAEDAEAQLQQMSGDEILECIETHEASGATEEEKGIHRLMQSDSDDDLGYV